MKRVIGRRLNGELSASSLQSHHLRNSHFDELLEFLANEGPTIEVKNLAQQIIIALPRRSS